MNKYLFLGIAIVVLLAMLFAKKSIKRFLASKESRSKLEQAGFDEKSIRQFVGLISFVMGIILFPFTWFLLIRWYREAKHEKVK